MQAQPPENGATIDVSAGINGVDLEGAQGLGKFLHDDARVPDCLVRNVYAYGVGRQTDAQDEDYLLNQVKAFAGNGYRFADLIAHIASSPEFFKVVLPGGAERPSSTASATSPPTTSRGVIP